MAKITKKNKRRIRIYFLLIIIIISYLSVFTYNYWSQILENNHQKEELENEYNALLEVEEILNTKKTRLEDPDYLAEYAREKLGYSKSSEIILKVTDD